MEKIKVLTSQNVSIEYPLALAGERIISNLIDLALKGAYAISVGGVLAYFNWNSGTLNMLLVFLPIVLYTPLSEIFLEGQTVGMRVRHTKVISLDGRPLSVGSILLRALLRIVDITISGGAIALISISLTKKGQRLGDIAAGTTVVKISRELNFSNIHFNLVPEDYQVRFEQVKELKEEEIRLIKDALTIYQKTQNMELLEATAKKVKQVLAVDTKMSPRKFLDAIVMDYNYLMGKI